MNELKGLIKQEIAQLSGKPSVLPEPTGRVGQEPVCPLCADQGIIYDATQDLARPCSCMRQKNLYHRFRHARISQQLQACSFARFDLSYYESSEDRDRTHEKNARTALRAAVDFCASCAQHPDGLGLFFTGPVGSGKTFLAAAMANDLLRQGVQILFVVVPDLLDEIKSTYDQHSEISEYDLIETARTVQVLILDDLGAHNYTDWTINKIYTILNYRLNEKLPTIITTNLSVREMGEFLGDRTTSRVVEMTQGYQLSCDRDIRLQKYQRRAKK
ncbi:MAG: ATP-binding protein [Peptococcaceae bacterium]|jgi:DNA replication protein DnaC|nr:ATP-binding protein [Peptococcaceae bacterium]